MIKRTDMIGNNFNPNRVENLKPHWGNLDTITKSVKARKIGSDETKLIALFKKHEIPFKYIGCSGFHVGKYFPDFISEDGKTLLEFIADTNEEIERRRLTYQIRGYNFLFIPTWQIRRGQIHKILKYLDNNGFKVKNIDKIWKKYFKPRVAWNRGKKLHYPVWNKGLTKEIDKRLEKLSRKMTGNQNWRWKNHGK